MRRVEIGLAVLLVFTIAIKMGSTRPADDVDRSLFAATASAMLTERGYDIGLDDRPSGIVVAAAKGGCRMTVREYRSDGIYAVTIADQARAVGPLRFAYRGALYAQPPKVRPLAEYYVRRGLQRFGMSPDRAPIVAVAASPECDVAALRWDRLAFLPR